MDFADTARAAEDTSKWKKVDVKSSLVPQLQPCKVM